MAYHGMKPHASITEHEKITDEKAKQTKCFITTTAKIQKPPYFFEFHLPPIGQLHNTRQAKCYIIS
jgi:hypothetical protein